MKSLYELKEKLCGELDELAAKSDMSLYDLDTLHKLTGTIKNVDEIMMIEESGYSEDGYSQARGGNRGGGGGRVGYSREGGGYSQEGGGSSYGGSSYNDGGGGYSQARRGQHYVRGHYSRDDGRESMMNHLESMMREAGSDTDREAIRRFMEEMRNA